MANKRMVNVQITNTWTLNVHRGIYEGSRTIKFIDVNSNQIPTFILEPITSDNTLLYNMHLHPRLLSDACQLTPMDWQQVLVFFDVFELTESSSKEIEFKDGLCFPKDLISTVSPAKVCINGKIYSKGKIYKTSTLE